LRAAHRLCERSAPLRAHGGQGAAELWGKPPYPPRTMIEVQRLFDDDIVEIDSVFYAPVKK
jgi:hypothetical protein